MRDYKKIWKDITMNGFFSEYLPPCFQLDEHILYHIPPRNCDLIPPLSFTMSRYNGNDARRTIFLPEIGTYLAAQECLNTDNILQELIEFTETSSNSFSPILSDDDSIVLHDQSYWDNTACEPIILPVSTQYINNIMKKIMRSVGAKQVLKLDISNCFSSFYTHMIPAILLGADNAEAEFRKFLLNSNDPSISNIYLKYRNLDESVRRQNRNQTNGLLPGPLSSKIIAEAILTRIDTELNVHDLNYSRYVDDYEVYLYHGEEKEVISIFSEILSKYGFTLNAEKSKTVDFPCYIEENFNKLLHGTLSEDISSEELMSIFNTFFLLEKNGTKGAIRYFLKTIETLPFAINLPIFKTYLISILANNERSLSKACSLLLSHHNLLTLDSNDVKIIRNMLNHHIECNHDLEVIWLLYLLIELKHIELGNELIQKIVDSKNELAKTILLRSQQINQQNIEKVTANATSWILLYELYASNKIEEGEFISQLNINRNKEMYRYFKRNNIHFCKELPSH